MLCGGWRFLWKSPAGCEPGGRISEDAVDGLSYSGGLSRSRGVVPDDRWTFTESLILAQDERWRRA